MIIGNFSILYLLLLIPLVVLLHILLRRMEKHEVGSLLIWERVKRKRKYRFPTFLLLLFQILVLSALTFSLADIQVPFTLRLRKENSVLVIDNSASMNVIENGKSRLDDAREKAIHVVKNSSGEIMIISSANPPEVITSYSSDRDELITGIKSIEATDLSNGIEESMKIASASVTPNGTIIMISDGAFNYIPSETDNFKFIRAGSESEYNIGITDFYLREHANSDAFELYMTINNFSSEDVPYELILRKGEEIIEREKTVISPGEEKKLVYEIQSKSEIEISAQLVLDDLLDADNRASSYISSNSRKRILLITPGNFFLSKALESLEEISVETYSGMVEGESTEDPGGNSTRIYTSSGIPVQKIPDDFDVVIFDRIPPPRLDDSGRYIYIDVIPSGIRSRGEKLKPQAVSINKKHRVLDSVDFNNVSILKAWPRLSDPLIEELVSGGNTGLLYVMDGKYLKFLYLPFDITESDLPLRSTFPILIKNSINWLTEGYKREKIVQFNTGDTIQIGTTDPLYIESEITDPRGNKKTVPDNIITDTELSGLYKFTYGNVTYFGSVNINNRDESDISSRFPEVTDDDKEEKTGEYKFPVITILLLLTMVLLLAEWLIQEEKW